MIKNMLGHFKTITKHKLVVFKLSLKAGIPWRGFVHDLSKYSPTEFLEGVKYFVGIHSPILEAKKDKGYSKAWLHHKGRNKHHLEYWFDFTANPVAPVIPYKYVVETVCDELAAGMVYEGKDWKPDTQYDYYINIQRKKCVIHPKIDNFLTNVFLQVKENGIDKTLTKKSMKSLYKKYCIDDKSEYIYEFEKGMWKREPSPFPGGKK